MFHMRARNLLGTVLEAILIHFVKELVHISPLLTLLMMLTLKVVD